MPADSIFAQLSLVIALAAGVALIMRLIKQPLIIGHIITGIIVGPSVFHLIKAPGTIETFSNIGIALLLFIIGLGLNPRVIKEVGKVATVTGILQVAATVILGWAGGLLFGMSSSEAFLVGLALSFSSTIIILKLLSDKKEQSRLYGKIATGLLLVQDVLAVIALLFVTAQTQGGGISTHQLGLLILRGLAIVVPIFLISSYVLPHVHKLIAGSSEFLFLFAIGWGFGIAALFAQAGFSIEIGALVAGVALASLPYTQEISARLRPLRDFFVIVFFISLGTRLGFGSIGGFIPLIIFSSIVVIVFKPLIVLTIMGLLGYTKNTSFKTAIATSQVSEFSLVLVILANRQGLISNSLVSAITLVALITIAVSTYLMLYNNQLFKAFEHYLGLFERHHTHFEREARQHYSIVMFGYNKGGHEFLKVFESLKKRSIVIDYDPEVVDTLEQHKINYVYGDATDIELLEEVGLDKTKLVVSLVSDHKVNLFLINLLEKINPDCVVILHADSVEDAVELYKLGASYVMLPHYIGSEKISAFIRRNGFKKSEFKRYREQHLAYLEHNYSESET